jgi:hypothetical protein
MLTPAEELGLAGLGLASRTRKAFQQIPQSRLIRLMEQIQEEAKRRHLVYLRDGEPETLRILPIPLTVLPDQLNYIQYVSQTIMGALKRLPELYIADPAVRDVLLLSPGEEQWLFDCWTPAVRENNPLFGRLDAMVDFISPMWKNSLRFVEPNLSGIGGLHLLPSAERILAELLLPLFSESDPSFQLELGPDIRDLLMREMLDHAQAIGRQVETLCFVEPKYAKSGPDEQEALASFYHERYGMRLLHADPKELSLQGDEVYYDSQRVDLVYRDYAVWDLLDLQREGANVEPMKALFRQNRIMSSIGAELDQKSCLEVLTDGQFSQKYFTADERQVFRKHVLWTRILSDRTISLPDGRPGDLLTYVRHARESLVLKPNRSFGGEGVILGLGSGESEWDAAIERALADKDRWVAQQLASIPVGEFSVLDSEGKPHDEPFYLVMGFAPSKYGLAVLGRASQKQVVNVAQRGGICVVMIGRSSERKPFARE